MRLPRPPALRAAPPGPRELRRAAAAAAAPSPPGDTRRASRLQQSLSCPPRGFSLINPSRLQNRFFFFFFFLLARCPATCRTLMRTQGGKLH